MKKSPWMDVAKFLGFGWYVAVSILLGTWVGVWLDRKLDTVPWLTLIGLFVGLVVALWGVYKMFAPLIKGNGRDEGKKK